MKTTKVFLAVLSLSFAAVLGCGNGHDLNRVSGMVTFNGEPLAGATITFTPEDPQGVLAVGSTDSSGRFVLAAPVQSGVTQGAMSGRYRVTIAKRETTPCPDSIAYQEGRITYDELQSRGGGGSGTSRDLIPARYGNAQQSGLEAEVVPNADNEFNFDLVD